MAIFNLIKGGADEGECPIEVVNATGTSTNSNNTFKVTLSSPVKSGSNWVVELSAYRKPASASDYLESNFSYQYQTGFNAALQGVTFKCNKSCKICGSYNTEYTLDAGNTYNLMLTGTRIGSAYKLELGFALNSSPTTSLGTLAYRSVTMSTSGITSPQDITIMP